MNMIPNTTRRMVLLVERLHEFVEQGADSVSMSALLGDDDEWTIGQEIQQLHDQTQDY